MIALVSSSWRERLAFVALVLGLGGCAFQTNVTRAPGAPTLPPSASAELVHAPPAGARELGTITAQGNNFQGASDCEARLVVEARKLGADVVYAQPEEAGFLQQGARCRGVAFARGAR